MNQPYDTPCQVDGRRFERFARNLDTAVLG